MAIVINMSNYEIERSSDTAIYNTHSQSNEWCPKAAQLNLQQFVPSKIHSTMPADLARVNIEMFLQNMIK